MNKMILRKMNTKFGRFLKRLIGEETGAVLMEYVILAVMIAAACVVAVIYFGRTANTQVNAASNAMGGNTSQASTLGGQAQSTASSGTTAADTHNKSFSDVK